MDLDPGTVVANRYRISRLLGRGGMGEVFAAENIRTGRPVAIKLLRQDSKAKTSAVARFRQEARAAGSINSDHVTQVLDVEEDPEHGVVLVFELLEGESLIERLKRTGPIAFEELWPIIEQVWLGLADAHRAGIVHRDLKPSNVFLERRHDGTTRVKILDFGISKVPKEAGGETLTEMGQSLGTFSFMPPEQIGKAKTVDHRADIYACATLIYQSLTGQLPYAARNILVMVEMKTKTDARKLGDAMQGPVDPRLEAFVARGLARDASQRFATAIDALHAWRDLRPQGPLPAHPASGQPVTTGETSKPPARPGTKGETPKPSGRPASGGALTPESRGKAQSRPPLAQSSSSLPRMATPPLIIDGTGRIPRLNVDTAEVSTDETAATLAMPMLRPKRGASAQAAPVLPSLQDARELSQVGPGGTQLVVMGGALNQPSTPRSPSGAPSSERPKVGRQPARPGSHPSPAESTPARSPRSSRSPPGAGPSGSPRALDDSLSSSPLSTTSDGQTQLYRARGGELPRRVRIEPSVPVPIKATRSASLVLVLLAFLLVGFAAVAIAMKVLKP